MPHSARPLPPAPKKAKVAKVARVQRSLERAGERDFADFKDELRKRERRAGEAPDPDEDFETLRGQFLRSDASYPLGPAMPPGASLRTDGQSHREAWMEVVRGDPCAYCGARESGTVDHVEPQKGPHAGAAGEVHSWLNFTASCGTCNGSKANRKLLGWLAGRRVKASPARSEKTPPSARNVALRSARRAAAREARRPAA